MYAGRYKPSQYMQLQIYIMYVYIYIYHNHIQSIVIYIIYVHNHVSIIVYKIHMIHVYIHMIPETLEPSVLQNSQVQLINQKIRLRFPTWVSAVNQILAELALNRWALREEDQFFSVEV